MGNLDSKLSPYYAIEDENNSSSTNSKLLEELFQNNSSFNSNLWTVKKANFNENKNSILFEFNYSKHSSEVKKVSTKHLNLALNQIKKLKVLRHPNIVKYLYSEEPQNMNHGHFKCLLITESIRPLNSIINVLSKEQILSGVFGITSGFAFLHEKAFISHNNINESCIYLNTKQVWKINDFELALNFADLNRENLKSIYEFKSKSAITPEEELEVLMDSGNTIKNSKFDMDLIYKQHPHSIDSYAWAMLVFNLLTTASKETNTSNKNGALQSQSATHGKQNSLFYSLEHKESTNSIANIIENEENEDKYCLDELEKFLNKDPAQRPTLNYALNLSLFDLYNNSSSNSMNSSYNEYVQNEENSSQFDLFKIDDLNKLEENWPKLLAYLRVVTQNESGSLSFSPKQMSHSSSNGQLKKSSRDSVLNERLIDFLLSPFMFFSGKVRKYIFPSVFIPREELHNRNNYDYLKLFVLSNTKQVKQQAASNQKEDTDENDVDSSMLEPFIKLDKYKALVLPRIINLFSMHSTQIRLALLEYFPFYITLVNDLDTLKYEILPELLLGLKDRNDELVSLTFCCLSMMVQLLGSETVVGQPTSSKSKQKGQPKTKYFSDNIPKTILHQHSNGHNFNNNKLKPESRSSLSSANKPRLLLNNERNLLNLTASFDEDILNMMNANDETMIKGDKIFSDSMIALHDENGSTNDLSSIISKNEIKSNLNMQNGGAMIQGQNMNGDENNFDQDQNDDEDWSNDFGWNQQESLSSNSILTNKIVDTKTTSLANDSLNNRLTIEKDDKASLVSLAGSEIFDKSQTTNGSISYSSSIGRDMRNQVLTNFKNSQTNDADMFSQYDIKNLTINVKKTVRDPSDDLIENFLNEITPKIEKKSSDLELTSSVKHTNSIGSGNTNGSLSNKNNIEMNVLSENRLVVEQSASNGDLVNKWDCDEISDLEE